MKLLSTAALAALQDGTAIVTGALEIDCDPPLRVWGGYGPLDLGGGMVFDPVGDRGIAQVAGGALGGAAQGITLTLSAIEPDLLELLDADDLAQAAGALWRLIFAGDGVTLLDAHVWARGRLDQLTREETIGGLAQLSAQLETAARGLGRRGGRMRTHADQQLVKPGDGFFRNVTYASDKLLYWGGRQPTTAGVAVGGYGGGSVGSEGRSFDNRENMA